MDCALCDVVITLDTLLMKKKKRQSSSETAG